MICNIFKFAVPLWYIFFVFDTACSESIHKIKPGNGNGNEPHNDFPFRNVSLPLSERVDDLVSRLTLDEIASQMSRGGGGGDGGPVLPIERLGISSYWWSTECIHGDAKENATAFPQSIGLAAMFKYV